MSGPARELLQSVLPAEVSCRFRVRRAASRLTGARGYATISQNIGRCAMDGKETAKDFLSRAEKSEKLENGAQMISFAAPALNTAAFSVVLPFVPEGRAGSYHCVEHLFFERARNQCRNDFARVGDHGLHDQKLYVLQLFLPQRGFCRPARAAVFHAHAKGIRGGGRTVRARRHFQRNFRVRVLRQPHRGHPARELVRRPLHKIRARHGGRSRFVYGRGDRRSA